ncbi:GPW/gp25 family protein [Solirubrobacter soli]|uniref:GPW/gp25 family protein n=1 Tax=Solirubrobacter soli TaxID=363832 RepID=UPI00041DC27B|nr:GPW/gp25 family protein [Solirubrobacter soli]
MNANGLDFPLHLDRAGNAARASSRASAVEQLIEELLFTNLGERLNRPTLGCGLLELVFDPAGDELRAATQFQVLSELQTWLGDLIRVQSVTAESTGAELTVTVTYAPLAGGAPRTAVFVR